MQLSHDVKGPQVKLGWAEAAKARPLKESAPTGEAEDDCLRCDRLGGCVSICHPCLYPHERLMSIGKYGGI